MQPYWKPVNFHYPDREIVEGVVSSVKPPQPGTTLIRPSTMLSGMPVIVIGADTVAGESILGRFEGHQPEREIRAFVTDEAKGLELKERGFKVATGDVSDESHVEAAALRCFSAVLVAEAAHDTRRRSFADTAEEVLRGWARAVAGSQVRRVIWVTDEAYPETAAPEVTSVDPSNPDLAETVAALDDAQSIS